LSEVASRVSGTLKDVSFDPELSQGARNAVRTCLRIQPTEKVTLITDEGTRDIAASIAREIEAVEAPFKAFVLEELAPRPLVEMPQAVLADMETSQVSIFAVNVQRNELKSRMQMTDVVNRRKMRHAHMVNINRQIMLEGMRADFCAVDELSQRLVDRARQVDRITCKTPSGTEFEAELSPKLKWLKTSGIITPDKWGNLPGGEIFTTPMNTNGVFVVDGVVGDYLCERFGDLQSNPLTIEVENNRIRALHSENKDLRDEFRAYTNTDENSDRVGGRA
jgi:leucyl aminopeptidase (aminopeptidase T)